MDSGGGDHEQDSRNEQAGDGVPSYPAAPETFVVEINDDSMQRMRYLRDYARIQQPREGRHWAGQEAGGLYRPRNRRRVGNIDDGLALAQREDDGGSLVAGSLGGSSSAFSTAHVVGDSTLGAATAQGSFDSMLYDGPKQVKYGFMNWGLKDYDKMPKAAPPVAPRRPPAFALKARPKRPSATGYTTPAALASPPPVTSMTEVQFPSVSLPSTAPKLASPSGEGSSAPVAPDTAQASGHRRRGRRYAQLPDGLEASSRSYPLIDYVTVGAAAAYARPGGQAQSSTVAPAGTGSVHGVPSDHAGSAAQGRALSPQPASFDDSGNPPQGTMQADKQPGDRSPRSFGPARHGPSPRGGSHPTGSGDKAKGIAYQLGTRHGLVAADSAGLPHIDQDSVYSDSSAHNRHRHGGGRGGPSGSSSLGRSPRKGGGSSIDQYGLQGSLEAGAAGAAYLAEGSDSQRSGTTRSAITDITIVGNRLRKGEVDVLGPAGGTHPEQGEGAASGAAAAVFLASDGGAGPRSQYSSGSTPTSAPAPAGFAAGLATRQEAAKQEVAVPGPEYPARMTVRAGANGRNGHGNTLLTSSTGPVSSGAIYSRRAGASVVPSGTPPRYQAGDRGRSTGSRDPQSPIDVTRVHSSPSRGASVLEANSKSGATSVAGSHASTSSTKRKRKSDGEQTKPVRPQDMRRRNRRNHSFASSHGSIRVGRLNHPAGSISSQGRRSTSVGEDVVGSASGEVDRLPLGSPSDNEGDFGGLASIGLPALTAVTEDESAGPRQGRMRSGSAHRARASSASTGDGVGGDASVGDPGFADVVLSRKPSIGGTPLTSPLPHSKPGVRVAGDSETPTQLHSVLSPKDSSQSPLFLPEGAASNARPTPSWLKPPLTQFSSKQTLSPVVGVGGVSTQEIAARRINVSSRLDRDNSALHLERYSSHGKKSGETSGRDLARSSGVESSYSSVGFGSSDGGGETKMKHHVIRTYASGTQSVSVESSSRGEKPIGSPGEALRVLRVHSNAGSAKLASTALMGSLQVLEAPGYPSLQARSGRFPGAPSATREGLYSVAERDESGTSSGSQKGNNGSIQPVHSGGVRSERGVMASTSTGTRQSMGSEGSSKQGILQPGNTQAMDSMLQHAASGEPETGEAAPSGSTWRPAAGRRAIQYTDGPGLRPSESSGPTSSTAVDSSFGLSKGKLPLGPITPQAGSSTGTSPAEGHSRWDSAPGSTGEGSSQGPGTGAGTPPPGEASARATQPLGRKGRLEPIDSAAASGYTPTGSPAQQLAGSAAGRMAADRFERGGTSSRDDSKGPPGGSGSSSRGNTGTKSSDGATYRTQTRGSSVLFPGGMYDNDQLDRLQAARAQGAAGRPFSGDSPGTGSGETKRSTPAPGGTPEPMDGVAGESSTEGSGPHGHGYGAKVRAVGGGDQAGMIDDSEAQDGWRDPGGGGRPQAGGCCVVS